MDPTTEVMVNFAFEMMLKIQRLEEEVKRLWKALKRSHAVTDAQRVALAEQKIYDELPHKVKP